MRNTASLEKHKQDWEDLGRLDPFWAILSDAKHQFGRWDPDAFFHTGQIEIDAVMSAAEKLGRPAEKKTVLDFGCGLGRLTRAFSKHFDRCHGVDISEAMIHQARELHRDLPRCEFHVSPGSSLDGFAAQSLDMIYSSLVLQHLPDGGVIRACIAEFTRVLKPDGLLVFQLPDHIPFLVALQPRRKLYLLLRRLGVSGRFLYEQLRLNPMRMNFIPEREVVGFLERQNARVLEIQRSTMPTIIRRPIQNRIYYVSPGGGRGIVT